MDAKTKKRQVRRTFISLSIAACMAMVAAGLGFVFAVRPVWSTSAQMQAEREASEVHSPVAADVQTQSLASITWEEAVAGFMSSYDDEPILQQLSVFEGIEPREFFKL
ncbi:MAG: hypothetical protein ACO3NE_11055, partial [Alphaproteobacteria bacterium]